MRQLEPNRDSEAFLSALADEFATLPDELIAERHVKAAAAVARSAEHFRRSRFTRWAAAVVVLTTVLCTGGIAVAGGLPAPIQSVMADMARALPIPFSVPYPVSAGGFAATEPVAVDRRPEDAEIEVDPHEPVETEAGVSSAPTVSDDSASRTGSAGGIGLDQSPAREGDGDRCDLRDGWGDRDRLAGEEVEALLAEVRRVCGFGLLSPPRWAYTSSSPDPDQTGNAMKDDRGDRGRDRDDTDEQDRDFDWASGSSDETNDRTDDQQEERHDDGDDADNQSSGDEWRDRHD